MIKIFYAQSSIPLFIPLSVVNIFTIIGIVGLISSTIMIVRLRKVKKHLCAISQRGAEYIVEMLHSEKGRQMLWQFMKWMKQ